MEKRNLSEFMSQVNKYRNDEIETWLNYIFNHYKREIKKNREFITLEEFLNEIYKVYLIFKEEYKEKCTLNFGPNMTFVSYEEKTARKLVLNVKGTREKNTDNPWPFSSKLFISENKGNYKATFISRNNLKYPLKQSDEILNNYLEFFGKYNDFFQFIRNLPGLINASNRRYIQISLDPNDGTFIDGIKGFNVSLAERDNERRELRYLVNIYVTVENGIKVDYSKSFMKIYKNFVEVPDKRLYNEMLTSLYIDCEDNDYDILTSYDSNFKKRI